MNRRSFLLSGLTFGAAAALVKLPLASAAANLDRRTGAKAAAGGPIKKVVKTNAEWKRLLTKEQYHVMREKGTEAPYASPLTKSYAKGVYQCVGCSLPLFSSLAKYDSETGWPSFWQPIAKQNVREAVDNDLAETRTEVLCARCDAHLGHVFDDGPKPTGLRYCMNGVALKFVGKG